MQEIGLKMSTRYVQFSFIWVSYPGLNSDVKAFLWSTIGCHIHAYGMEFIDLSESDIKQLKTLQGNTIQRVMGISKLSHHSSNLQALAVPTVDDVIKDNTMIHL